MPIEERMFDPMVIHSYVNSSVFRDVPSLACTQPMYWSDTVALSGISLQFAAELWWWLVFALVLLIGVGSGLTLVMSCVDSPGRSPATNPLPSAVSSHEPAKNVVSREGAL